MAGRLGNFIIFLILTVSTNINANMFKKYGACKDCGHKWKILKLGSAGDGGGEDKYGYVGFEQAIKKGHMPL